MSKSTTSSGSNRMFDTLGGAAGAVGSKVFEGFFHMNSEKAKSRANLFSIAGDLAKNGDIKAFDVEFLKVFLDNEIIDSIFEAKMKLILESDLSYEEKLKQLDEFLMQYQEGREERTEKAERVADKKLLGKAVLSGSFVLMLFTLAFMAKKLRMF